MEARSAQPLLIKRFNDLSHENISATLAAKNAGSLSAFSVCRAVDIFGNRICTNQEQRYGNPIGNSWSKLDLFAYA
ncbi:MAG TPA: hypothetical protein DCY26_05465 [Hyphomonas sp.]|nr:hypothetical protein [Hyphomonas sp.]